MDSTRAIPLSKHSTCLSTSTQKGSSMHCYNNGPKNTGGMYTIGNSNGGQILMNSHDINKATHLQFSPPTRSKSTNTSHTSPGKSNGSTSDHNGSIYTTKTASMMCNGPPACQDIGKSIIVDTMATKKLLSAVIRQQQNNCSTIMSTTFMAKFPTKNSLELLADDKALFIEHSTHANYYQTKPTSTSSTASAPNHSKCNGGLGDDTIPNDGNKLVNSIKSFFSAIIRPIIDTTSLIVGNDTKPELIKSNGIGQTANQIADFVSGNCCQFEIQNSNPKNIKFYGNQMHCRHSPTIDMMDNVPFFDCDDFIEGGEDQVDFVADSTKFEWQHTNHHSNARYFDDLMLDEVKARSLSKENIFYDCMPTIGMDSPIKQQQQQQQQIQQHMPDPKAIESTIDKSIVIDESAWKPMAVAIDNDNETVEAFGIAATVADCNSFKMKTQTEIDDNQNINNVNVQYEKDECEQKPKTKSTTITPKLDAVIPKRHSYRRSKHRKNNQQNNNKRTNNRSNYCHKKTASNKNRHKKSRHELEMNIHDDIDEMFNDDLSNLSSKNSSFHRNHNTEVSEINDDGNGDGDDADNIDLEIIDLDKIWPTTSSALDIPSKSSNELAKSADILTISPETISSGCIFTKFFRFDNSKCSNKPKSLPYRLAQKLMPQMRSMQTERNLSMCRTSETESDDSFIVFEDHSPNNLIKSRYSRQRQLSECSDDFILFERDDDLDSNMSHDDDDDEVDDDTDEDDYTESTDDSADEMDDSDSESDNESDCIEIFEEKRRDYCNQPDSGFEEKKVSFNLCPKVHEIRAWRFAYSAARKGQWEQIYRDRKRFEDRINDLNRVIAPVLTVEHRQQIFDGRFKEPLPQQPQSQKSYFSDDSGKEY